MSQTTETFPSDDFETGLYRQDLYLQVPHHSQLGEAAGIDPEQARKICALVCLKTVLEYEQPSVTEGFSIQQLKSLTEANGGRAEEGWKHAAQVDTLKNFGLTAWRRNWEAPTQDPLWLAQNEGYNASQIYGMYRQLQVEQGLDSNQDKLRASVIGALQEQHPVVVSMAPGFSGNRANHQVVVHGYRRDSASEQFFVTDPLAIDSVHQTESVPPEKFFEFFQNKAIFVSQAKR